MMRFTMWLVAALILSGASSVRGQDAEVKQLKKEIELLQAKLEASNLKIEKLQAENDRLKAGGATGTAGKPATDGFGAGTKLAGAVVRSWAGANGKRVVMGDDVEFEVTKRSGTEFTAEFWADKRKVGAEVEGTINANGVVKFKSTKSLTDQNVNLVGVHTFTGRLDKGVLTGTTKKKGDESYKGEWKLKPKQE